MGGMNDLIKSQRTEASYYTAQKNLDPALVAKRDTCKGTFDIGTTFDEGSCPSNFDNTTPEIPFGCCAEGLIGDCWSNKYRHYCTRTNWDSTNKDKCCTGEIDDIKLCDPGWQYPQGNIVSGFYNSVIGSNDQNVCKASLENTCKGDKLDKYFACNDYCSKNPDKCNDLQNYCQGEILNNQDSICNKIVNSRPDILADNLQKYCINDNLKTNNMCKNIALNTKILDTNMEKYCDNENNFLSDECKNFCNHTLNNERNKTSVCNRFVGTQCTNLINKIENNNNSNEVAINESKIDPFCSCFVNLDKVYPGKIDIRESGYAPCFYKPCNTNGYKTPNMLDQQCPNCLNIINLTDEMGNYGNLELIDPKQICDISKIDKTTISPIEIPDNKDNQKTTILDNIKQNKYILGGIGGVIISLVLFIFIILIIFIIFI